MLGWALNNHEIVNEFAVTITYS